MKRRPSAFYGGAVSGLKAQQKIVAKKWIVATKPPIPLTSWNVTNASVYKELHRGCRQVIAAKRNVYGLEGKLSHYPQKHDQTNPFALIEGLKAPFSIAMSDKPLMPEE